jgi:hypothetical protein
MVTQRRKHKLSSGGKKLLQRFTAGEATLHDVSSDIIAFEEVLLSYFNPTRRMILVDLVNSRDMDGIKWFWRKWEKAFRPETLQDLLGLSEDLRKLWGIFVDTGSETEEYPTSILNRWLSWRPSPEQFGVYRNWRRGEEVERVLGFRLAKYEYAPFWCSTASASFVPDPNCFRGALIQGVLEHSSHFSYCENPDCLAPYFIAKRIDQTVCNAEICKAEKQRAHARKWWSENRAKKSHNQLKLSSATATKRSREHVTKKAR